MKKVEEPQTKFSEDEEEILCDFLYHHCERCLEEGEPPPNLKIINFLLDNGAGVDTCDGHFRTVLSRLCEDDRNIDAVKLLIKRGADLYQVNDNDESPMDVAKEHNSKKILRHLRYLETKE